MTLRPNTSAQRAYVAGDSPPVPTPPPSPAPTPSPPPSSPASSPTRPSFATTGARMHSINRAQAPEMAAGIVAEEFRQQRQLGWRIARLEDRCRALTFAIARRNLRSLDR